MPLRALALALLSLFFVAGTASADKVKAKEYFRRGMAKYTLEKWDEAIADFEAGYTEEPDPSFLYNIAQAHRLANRPKQALDFYRKFLVRRPDAPNRGEIERQMKALETTMKPSEALPPPNVPAPEPARPAVVKPAPAPVTSTPPVVAAPPPQQKEVAAQPPPPPPPPREVSQAPTAPPVSAATPKPAAVPAAPAGARLPVEAVAATPAAKPTWPIWVGVIAGVVVVGGVTTGAVLATSSNGILLAPENAR